MRVGARDTAIALSSRVIVLLVSVGIQSVLARALGPDGRGSYAVCVLFATVLGTLFTLGIDLAGQYFAASGRMTRAESIGGAMVALGVCSVLAVITGRLLLETNIAFFAKADRSSFLISLVVVPTVIATGAGVAFLIGLGKFKWMVIVETVNIVLQLTAALVLVLWLRLDVDGALWSIVVAGVGSSCLAAWFLARVGALARFSQSVSKYRALVSYGLRFVVAKLSTILHLRIGTLLIAFFVSPADIGLFATASVLVTQVLMVPIAVENALFSRVARQEGGRPELVARAVRVSTILCAVLLAILVLASRLMVLVILTPEFLPTVPLIAIMAPGILVRVGGRVMMTYFRGTDRPAICSWAVVIGIVVNILCILAFLPAFGLPGAALAMTAGYVASSLVLGVAFKSATGQSFIHTWLPRRSDVATLMVVAQCLLRARSQEEETSIPSE